MRIARAALILMLGNVASRLLGVVREQVIAALFGASAATDAFTAAARVPTTVYDLLIGGMISAALVPVFSDYAEPARRAELRGVGSVVINAIFLALALAVILLVGLAPQLMRLYGAGFDQERLALSIELVRFMLPAVLFMGLSGVLTALLYSQQRFALPAFAVAIYNGGIIVGIVVLFLPLGVASLAMGVLLGAALQMALQAPGLRGVGYSFSLNLAHPGVRRILTLYLPVALGLVVSAIGVAIDSNLASRTGEGNMAAMRFATTLTQFPLGLIASATSLALLPTLSRYASALEPKGRPGGKASDEAVFEAIPSEAALGDQPVWLGSEPLVAARGGDGGPDAMSAYKETLALGLKVMVLAILPAAVGLVMLRFPLISALFERGAFDADATSRTALAFLFYAPGLPAAAVDQLLIFAFYARKNTVTPVLVGVMGVLVYLAFGLALLGPMGMPGLALANSLQWIAHAALMLVLLWRAVGGLGGLGLAEMAIKSALASSGMAGLLYLLSWWLAPAEGAGLGALAAYLVVALALGGAVYGLCLTLLRVREVGVVWRLARQRLGK